MFGWGGPKRPEMVAFDAIGTLFPLDPLRPLVTALGLPAPAVEAVYGLALRNAFALAAMGAYKPFRAAMADALDEVLFDHGRRAPGRAKSAVLDGMGFLAARPDAGAAFRTLHAARIGVAILTNGSLRETRARLERTGLAPLVDLVVSVDEVGLSKPRPEVYRHMAKRAGIRPKRLALVAAHAWDLQGAAAAGLTTAYLADRPFSRLMDRPDIQATSLLQLAHSLAAL